MTYSFAIPFDDIARVRFAVGDNDATAHRFDDELITALITEYEGWKPTVIACIDAIINDVLSTPDFTADWLKIESTKALAFYEKLRARKIAEYGLTGGLAGDQITLTGSVISPTRSDRDE